MVVHASGRIAATLGLFLVLRAGCASSGSNKAGGHTAHKPLVLTLANFLPTGLDAGGFAANVARLSHGALRIEVESGWRAGQVKFEDALIGDVSAGKADLGIVGARAWDSLGVRTFRPLGAPLLINSYALQDAVLTSDLTAPMLKGLGPLGLTGVGVLPGSLRYPVGITRPLLRTSDYAGQTIGVQQSLVASATFRALGAKPVWFSVQPPIRGLNGFEQGIGNIPADRYPTIVTANVALWPRPLVLFANRGAFARLSPAQQQILREAVDDDVRGETIGKVAQERQVTANLCRARLVRFVDATPVELAALRRAVAPLYGELDRDQENRRQIAQIEAIRTKTPPQPPPRCPMTTALHRAAGPLDGVYQYRLDYTELKAAHADAGDISPSNVGTFTFVFDRGHFAETVENPQSCAWNYGTVSVTGSRLSLLYSEGGGVPASAANQLGEQFALGWSLYRDSLTMRSVPGGVSPTPFLAVPWLRVSTTPSRSYLSRRCPPPANALPG
jgi:TRAP-type C4-dicarboxylate transport system substrate-binding protein